MAAKGIMRYDRPADAWCDALPLGNGRLGAMVYGHTRVERMQLNEDSLWYGKAMERNNPRLKDALPRIRRHIFAGEIRQAEDLIQRYMLGAPYSMRHYESLGEIDIGVNCLSPFSAGWSPTSEGAQDYSQALDLFAGVHHLSWREGDTHFTRECFISHPDQVLCVRYRADRPGALQMNVRYDRGYIFEGMVPDPRRPGQMIRAGGWGSMFLDDNHTVNDGTLIAGGNAGGTVFGLALGMDSDGPLSDAYTQLYTENASCVCLYLAAATDNRETDPSAWALQRVNDARDRGFDALMARHRADFTPRMARCVLDLPDACDEPIQRRIAMVKAGGSDPGLAALYFAFGRYLMLAGGREDSAALNLQGIWCKDFAPMWDSKYTTNINVQMNYWPAEVCNLSETHASLFSLIEAVWRRGQKTARVMYGARGSVCHHNTDYYGDTAPQDQYMASTAWTAGGAWMALHLWEHFLFTGDREFLKKWRPVMREFAIFFVDFLTDDGAGFLVTCPSLSPENRYILPDGYDTPICAGPAMDSQILRDLFSACIQADALLQAEDEWTEEFRQAARRLPPDQIGSKGQLLEWRREWPEKMPGMSHISHLYAAYPSSQINWKDTPELMAAVRRSLQLRVENGAAGGGWPLAWRMCQYARLLDGGMVGRAVDQMLGRAADSFLNGRRIFQIDGNLGAVAGMAEALLQSHAGLIHLLPALPPAWRKGSVRGLMARGGVQVDIRWEEGRLAEALLRPQWDGEIEVRADDAAILMGPDCAPVPAQRTAWGWKWTARAGETYALRGEEE
ncbi:MAG: glycoside hydrolase family 95 protein [Clostridia bacterium]|nr:glycoside hydrolase family 95 protein [Clostridia bacterium]